MKKKSLLDSIDVPKPCDKSWDEMIGDDVSRFCRHCEKDIYNISAMTRKEAKKLLFQSKERVCIRMERETDGRIKTLKKQLHQITRQMPLAAGVLTASMILSGVTNAQETKVETGKITITQIADKNSKPTISGTITDSNGAVVAGIRIFLRNTKDNSTRFATSNDSGFYEFKDVEVSNYEVVIDAQYGFQAFVENNLVVTEGKNLDLKTALKTPLTTTLDFVFETPTVETETPPINTNVIYQEIVPLPKSTYPPTVLGFPKFPVPTKHKIKKLKNLSQISFTIFDKSGAIIPKAKVFLTKQITNEEFSAMSNQEGMAEFREILRGNYELKIIAPNFQSFKQTIKVKKAIESNIKITLTAGTIGEVIFIKKDNN